MTLLWGVVALVALIFAGGLLSNGRSTTWLDQLRRTDPDGAARLEERRAEEQLRAGSGGNLFGGGI